MLVLFCLRFLCSIEMVYELKAWRGTWEYPKSQSAHAQYTNVMCRSGSGVAQLEQRRLYAYKQYGAHR